MGSWRVDKFTSLQVACSDKLQLTVVIIIMNYDHYLLTCWYIAIYIFTLLHVLKRGSFDVYGKDKILQCNLQIINFC